jgi:putative sugar O-methyltransferase
MGSEVNKSSEIYRPSNFWLNLNKINSHQLYNDGYENFKRTLNQNYYNWAPTTFDDNQLTNLLEIWNKHRVVTPLLTSIDEDHEMWNMFGENLLESNERATVYAFFVGLLWWYASTDDPLDLTDRLVEPIIGNPIPVVLDKKLISQDLANSIIEFNTIFSYIKELKIKQLVVAEIGAGYGRLGYVFEHALNCRYVIFDIPPALYISERYLRESLPNKKIFHFRSFKDFHEIEDELLTSDIAFFTPNQIEFFPEEYFDISVSISALHEMRVDQIKNFMAKLSAITSKIIYLKNWTSWHNEEDKINVKQDEFILSSSWFPVLDRVDRIQNLFTEKLFMRNKEVS